MKSWRQCYTAYTNTVHVGQATPFPSHRTPVACVRLAHKGIMIKTMFDQA